MIEVRACCVEAIRQVNRLKKYRASTQNTSYRQKKHTMADCYRLPMCLGITLAFAVLGMVIDSFFLNIPTKTAF